MKVQNNLCRPCFPGTYHT